jgi:hypothetical protein
MLGEPSTAAGSHTPSPSLCRPRSRGCPWKGSQGGDRDGYSGIIIGYPADRAGHRYINLYGSIVVASLLRFEK